MKPAKLHYFKGRGRAETTRWMLAINNIDFINISLEDHNDFDNLKASGKLPFNQLPLLELDDLRLSQSSAMISFLARRGLHMSCTLYYFAAATPMALYMPTCSDAAIALHIMMPTRTRCVDRPVACLA